MYEFLNASTKSLDLIDKAAISVFTFRLYFEVWSQTSSFSAAEVEVCVWTQVKMLFSFSDS